MIFVMVPKGVHPYFEPVYRGRRVAGHPALDPARITTLGLIISRQEGPFRLELRSIRGLPRR